MTDKTDKIIERLEKEYKSACHQHHLKQKKLDAKRAKNVEHFQKEAAKDGLILDPNTGVVFRKDEPGSKLLQKLLKALMPRET